LRLPHFIKGNQMKLARSISSLAFAATLTLLVGTSATAQGGYVYNETFGYTGSVTRYNSLGDAQTNTGALYSGAFQHRDLTLYFVDNNAAFNGAGYPPSAAQFLTYWYANGGVTPANTNHSFIQMADDDAASVTSMSMAWLDPARTSFGFNATGANTVAVPDCPSSGSPATADASNDCGRLWNGDNVSPSASLGSFINWTVTFSAFGLTPAVFNPTTGVFESASAPASVTGSMFGIFQNTSETTADNGFYRYDLAIDNLNLPGEFNGESVFGTNDFGSTDVVPEPATMTLLATGLAGLAASRRRKKA